MDGPCCEIGRLVKDLYRCLYYFCPSYDQCLSARMMLPIMIILEFPCAKLKRPINCPRLEHLLDTFNSWIHCLRGGIQYTKQAYRPVLEVYHSILMPSK
jgi:hypothetical protein